MRQTRLVQTAAVLTKTSPAVPIQIAGQMDIPAVRIVREILFIRATKLTPATIRALQILIVQIQQQINCSKPVLPTRPALMEAAPTAVRTILTRDAAETI